MNTCTHDWKDSTTSEKEMIVACTKCGDKLDGYGIHHKYDTDKGIYYVVTKNIRSNFLVYLNGIQLYSSYFIHNALDYVIKDIIKGSK